MSKTDDMIKGELESIGNYKALKMRGFIGSSTYDQRPWTDGGLTFQYDGKAYGSCDFAWYKEEEWIDPNTNAQCNSKPVLVVEGTDCLNTNSFGSAQLQRFHHAYGPFMNGGIIGVYYLREGVHAVRADLMLAVYYANIVEKYKERKAAYLVLTKLADVEKLVKTIGDFGEYSPEVWELVDAFLNRMKDYALSKIASYPTYESYLNKRCIFQRADGAWIKYLGAKKRSFLTAAGRYGHIVLGEGFVSHYLLAGRNLLVEGKPLYYLLPLLSGEEYADLKNTLIKDKEFHLLSTHSFWKVLTIDEITFEDSSLKETMSPFKELNLNTNRKEGGC